MIVDYYKKLFTTSNPHNIEEVVQSTNQVVSDEMNNCLTRDFSKVEVENALKQMAPHRDLMECCQSFSNIIGKA